MRAGINSAPAVDFVLFGPYPVAHITRFWSQTPGAYPTSPAFSIAPGISGLAMNHFQMFPLRRFSALS